MAIREHRRPTVLAAWHRVADVHDPFGTSIEIAGPRRLSAARLRNDHAAPLPSRGKSGRQHARDSAQDTVQSELAEDAVALDLLARQHAHDDQQADRDGEVKMTSLFQHVGRGEIYRDAFRRQSEAERRQRRTHALAALADRLVRESNQREGRQARRHLHLNIDIEAVDPLERHRPDTRDHGVIRPPAHSQRLQV